MPRSYSPEVRRQVIELARAGTKVKRLATTFRRSDATIYGWLKRDRIDRGEAEGAAAFCQLGAAIGATASGHARPIRSGLTRRNSSIPGRRSPEPQAS